jgi:hypothetical protein
MDLIEATVPLLLKFPPTKNLRAYLFLHIRIPGFDHK